MVGFISKNLIDIFTKLVLVRVLLPVEFGIFATAYVFINLARVLSETGISASIIQGSAIDNEILSSSFIFNILTSLIFLAAALFFSPFIAGYFNDNSLVPVIRVLSVALFIESLVYIQNAFLIKNLNFRNTVIPQLGAVIMYSVSGIVFAYLKFGLWSLVWASLVRSIATSVLFYRITPWKPQLRFDYAKFSPLLSFGIKVDGVKALRYIKNNIGYLVIAKFLGPLFLGYYFVAYELAHYYNHQICPLLSGIFFPLLSQIKDNEKLQEYHFKTFKYSFIVGVPVYVIIFALCKEILISVFGSKWAPSVLPAQVLSLVAYFTFTESPVFSAFFIAKGNVEKLLKIYMFMLLINSVAVFGGIAHGIAGVALFLLFAALLNFVIIIIFAARALKLGLREYAAKIYPFFMPSAITMSILLFLNNLPRKGAVFLLLEIPLVLLSYAVLLRLHKIYIVQEIKSFYQMLVS